MPSWKHACCALPRGLDTACLSGNREVCSLQEQQGVLAVDQQLDPRNGDDSTVVGVRRNAHIIGGQPIIFGLVLGHRNEAHRQDAEDLGTIHLEVEVLLVAEDVGEGCVGVVQILLGDGEGNLVVRGEGDLLISGDQKHGVKLITALLLEMGHLMDVNGGAGAGCESQEHDDADDGCDDGCDDTFLHGVLVLSVQRFLPRV